MKKLLLLVLTLSSLKGFAQTPNDVLNVLIANKTITQEQADSLRAEAAIKQQESDAAKKSFPVTASRSLQFSGYTQARYQSFAEKGKYDGFDLRRARVSVNGNISPYFSCKLQVDLAGSPKLLDAYAEVKINDYLNFTIGQFTIPFSLENLSSMNKYEVIDYSQVVDALTARGKDVIGNQNGRDIGIQVGGTLIKTKSLNIVEYRLGIFNGSGINIADTANEAKDIVGRLILNPVKGLSFGASYYNGWGKAIKPATVYIGRSQPRNRFGVEASYTTARTSLKSEYISGTDGKVKKQGWYFQAGYYLIEKKLQAVVRYDSFDPNTDKNDNNTSGYALGMNFNFNNWSRIQAFYTIRQEEAKAVDNNLLSFQYQIGF